jgi:hypothetical protein
VGTQITVSVTSTRATQVGPVAFAAAVVLTVGTAGWSPTLPSPRDPRAALFALILLIIFVVVVSCGIGGFTLGGRRGVGRLLGVLYGVYAGFAAGLLIFFAVSRTGRPPIPVSPNPGHEAPLIAAITLVVVGLCALAGAATYPDAAAGRLRGVNLGMMTGLPAAMFVVIAVTALPVRNSPSLSVALRIGGLIIIVVIGLAAVGGWRPARCRDVGPVRREDDRWARSHPGRRIEQVAVCPTQCGSRAAGASAYLYGPGEARGITLRGAAQVSMTTRSTIALKPKMISAAVSVLASGLP